MNQLHSDPFYISFSQYSGFVIRLQKKSENDFVERFIKQINNYTIIPELTYLINTKDVLTE
jgi:hypothetical protein